MNKSIPGAIVIAIAMTACGTEDVDLVNLDVEIVENLVAAGFPASDIQLYDGKVYVGRDAHVTLEASREMLVSVDSTSEEQYRTTNLVSASVQDICVDGRRMRGTLSTALDLAIENFNNEGLSFTMRRVGRNKSGCDAVISARQTRGVGGSAGFPSGGLPYNRINIGRDTAQFGVDTVEHVTTHELGHCIGFRHSDYFDRSISCGSGGNEGQAGVGAILIPGTPAGATVGGSIMNSCFRASETGEFTSTDQTALGVLYGG